MPSRIFKEEQSYRGTWIMYLILLLEIPTMVILTVVMVNSNTNGDENLFALFGVICLMIGVMLFILNIRLVTRIDDQGVHFRYFPLVKWQKIQKAQIQSAKVVSFSPLTDHGGWGIKGNSTTRAYTIIGDQGLELDIDEKKKLVIGTQKPKELSEFMANWMEE